MKDIIKNKFIPLISGPAISRVAAFIWGNSVPVFMLHRMQTPQIKNPGGTTASHLEYCLQYLKNRRYHFLPLEELIHGLTTRQPLPPRCVVFTMDDGYVEQAEIALPIFEAYGCPVTFFVITGMLDQDYWPWDAKIAWIIQTSRKTTLPVSINGKLVDFSLGNPGERRNSRRAIQDYLKTVEASLVLGILHEIAETADVAIPRNPPPEYMPMSWDQARQHESDLVRFAPHSNTHNILSRLDPASLEAELRESWKKIASELTNPSKIFCYPTGRPGDYGLREITTLVRLGYTGAVSTTAATVDLNNPSRKQRFAIPRYSLPDEPGTFVQYCSWLEFARMKLSRRQKIAQ